MKAAIMGAGYVGLTTGAALAYLGHKVVVIDVDKSKIQRLKKGCIPIYEPGLDDLLELAQGNISFATAEHPLKFSADVVFIAVGTPPMADGRPNLSAVCSAARRAAAFIGDGFTVIVNKSTVPIGSAGWVESIISDTIEGKSENFAVASNPEFLREGCALFDILYPDRIVFGSDDPRALGVLSRLYKPLIEQSFPAPDFLPRPEKMGQVPVVATDVCSAELTKYASNAFLSAKISFINEIGHLAEKVGADIRDVARGMGLDSRIGPRFLQAGLGWGGSCFGKDTAALVATGKDYGLEMPLVAAVRKVNYSQRQRVVEKLQDCLKILKGKTIGLMGLSFKPNTDDLRDSPALDIAQQLVDRGAKVRVHDPVAMERAKEACAEWGVQFCSEIEAIARGADAIVLATDWPEYAHVDWEKVVPTMRHQVVLDGRNFLDRSRLKLLECEVIGF